MIEGKKERRKESRLARSLAHCYRSAQLSSVPSLAVCFVKERVNGIGGPAVVAAAAAAAPNDDVSVPFVGDGSRGRQTIP